MADVSIRQTIIYGLVDPRNQQIRYVGKTSGRLHSRRLAHISDVRRGRTYIPRHRWLAELLSSGLEPEIFEIEVVIDNWQEAEQFWISYYRFIGADLLNATDGGDGLVSYRHKDETRKKQSESAKARYQRAGEREKTGAAVLVGQSYPGYKEKWRAAVGEMSPETRAKLSVLAKLHRGTPEARLATSLRMKGRIVSEKTRLKISMAKIGRSRSAASIEKQSATLMGKQRGGYRTARRAEWSRGALGFGS